MTQPRDETRKEFDAALGELRRESVQLGSMVLENVKRLTEAVTENRLDVAEEVIGADEEIDERYAELERKTFRLIALQQPVAGDLRFLVSITRILYEIERSGDLAVNAAKGLRRQHGYTLSPPLRRTTARLCEATADMFAKGLDVLGSLDVEAGIRLDEEDDVVDDLVSELYELISSADLDVDTAIELSRTGRYMERIADHAVNIGDHVAFVVTGSFPRSVTSTAEEGD
ncbi:MAG TPA: phosphate signaling complex protein PhoU [Acidimicrobiia bacterium]|nr:phosphate signaling complex protein PhoU [Acidimicrobiia bacterium]